MYTNTLKIPQSLFHRAQVSEALMGTWSGWDGLTSTSSPDTGVQSIGY